MRERATGLPCLLTLHLRLAVTPPRMSARSGFLWLRDRQDRFTHWPSGTAQSPALIASQEVRVGLKVPTLGSHGRFPWQPAPLPP